MKLIRSNVIMSAGKLLLALMCLGIFAVAGFAQAQANAADLFGNISDPNGAVVTGATVTARSAATGISRTATTDSDGNYRLIGLTPGESDAPAEATTVSE